MKLRVLVFGLAWAFCLYGQNNKKGFDFTEACFKNPRLPYCPGRDFAPKPDPKGGSNSGTGSYATAGEVASTIDAAGIDWRFADPSADALAVLNGGKLSAASLAHTLIGQLGSNHGLSPAEAQNIFQALSGVKQIALSVREDKILLMVTGRPPDSILPAPKPGWKSVPLGGTALLMGNADAVDQASQRLASVDNPLGELQGMAQQRPGESEFWAAGSAKLAGQAAAGAGVKRFELIASMLDRFACDTVFEFDAAPDPSAIRTWLSTLGGSPTRRQRCTREAVNRSR